MLTELNRYGAVGTKVRAMFGRRLHYADFAKLADMHAIPEALAYLKSHPACAQALVNVTPSELGRDTLEIAFRRQLREEYCQIMHYFPKEDHFLLRYQTVYVEVEQLMYFFKLFQIGRQAEYTFNLPAYFTRYSQIQYAALASVTNYAGFLEAVRHTDFYPQLARLTHSDGSFPDFTAIDMVMRSYFYRTTIKRMAKQYRGQTYDILRESIGSQADLLNVTHIFRIRHYYPNLLDDIFHYLIPVNYHLRPATVKALYQAPTTDDAFSILRATPYGKHFDRYAFPHMEGYYYQYLYDFNSRQMRTGMPTLYMPIAYLHLRELECLNLIRILECVRYGIPAHEALSYVRGLTGTQL